MAQQNNNIRIGITQGDINGIGLEIIVKTLSNHDILELFTPVIFGSAELLRKTAEALHVDDFHFEVVKTADEIADGRINVIETCETTPVQTPGIPSEEGGKAAVASLKAATAAIEDGTIDLLVTAPIDKKTAKSGGFDFTGHTEYLEDRFVVEGGKALMILAYDDMRVALVTTHLPLSEVAKSITKEKIEESIRNFNRALKMDFGCERPKIAVLSLNPHCGDGGVLGDEELSVILPAVEQCKREGIMAFGPIAADGLFGSGACHSFDGILAMYHDQGLAPFKALAGARGVNYTAGLNIIRTSPDHGTAYDKAGHGIADETSMREAIYAAIDIAKRRDIYLDASENPLKITERPQKEHRKKQEQTTEAEEAKTPENGRD